MRCIFIAAVRADRVAIERRDHAAAFDAITAKGARIKEAPKAIARVGGREVWLGFTEDPDGHPVGIMSEVPVDAA